MDFPLHHIVPPNRNRGDPAPRTGLLSCLFLEISADQVPAVLLGRHAAAHARELFLSERHSPMTLAMDFDEASCFMRLGPTF